MRLNQFQISTIKQIAKKHFGIKTSVFLFGSRTDDQKRGGDIDLFITCANESILTVESKIRFLVDLKNEIGSQKIDVVFDNAYTRQKSKFYESVIHQKIEL